MNLEDLAKVAVNDPSAAVPLARQEACCPDLSPDDRNIVRWILQPWWETCEDAGDMMLHAGKVAEAEGLGTNTHFIVAWRSVLFAGKFAELFHPSIGDIVSLLNKSYWSLMKCDHRGAEEAHSEALRIKGEITKDPWFAKEIPSYAASCCICCSTAVAAGNCVGASARGSATYAAEALAMIARMTDTSFDVQDFARAELARMADFIRSTVAIVPIPGDML